MEIYSITTNLSRYGGAQKVLLDVHNGLKKNFDVKIIGFQKYSTLHPKYNIPHSEYLKLTSPFQLNDKILLVHARNVISIIMILKFIFRLNTKVIYVAHNVYSDLSWATFLPITIVSISKKVSKNLIDYFKVPAENIRLIYNGIENNNNIDFSKRPEDFYEDKIRILYSARVNSIKRQIEIVNNLKGKLHPSIEIIFAGTGENLDQLKLLCANDNNFRVLGFVENMYDLISSCHYMMLYSVQEGLPLALIEGCMLGKPLLVNDVGGNLEIAVPGFNGIQLPDDWKALHSSINSLVNIDEKTYLQMSINSKEIFEEKFRYEKMIIEYTNLIDSLNS